MRRRRHARARRAASAPCPQAAQPLTGKRLSEHTIMFAGDGRGATAAAEVCLLPALPNKKLNFNEIQN